MQPYEPFLGFVMRYIDKLLGLIGMNKTEFFSLCFILLAIGMAWLPPEWQAWLKSNRTIIEAVLLGGMGLGISDRLGRIRNQISNEEVIVPPRKYW